jgi:hypothetical protein
MRWKAQKKFFSDRDFESELRVILDGACGKDPVFKSAIADNRWYIDKSVMYGQSAAIEALLLLVERLGSK